MKASIFNLLLAVVLTGSASSQQLCTWIGSYDSNWSNSNNWLSNNLPTNNDTIVIQNGVYAPIADQDIYAGVFYIDSGATFHLNGMTLFLSGNWFNEGNFVAEEGIVSIESINHPFINGTQTFYTLEINCPEGATIASGVSSIEYELIIMNGTLNTNGSLVLLSNVNMTASIPPITSGSISGDVTVHRYISGNTAGWRFLSSPVTDATLVQLQDDFWTAGFPGSTFPTNTFQSVYYYDETVPGGAENGYQVPDSCDDNLISGKGFMAYIDSTSLQSVLDFTGTLLIGSINIPLEYTLSDTISDGWNLVGNPYPSAINWDDISIDKNLVYNAIYIWDPEAGVYTSYVDGIGANGGSRYIAQGQSFYVQSYETGASINLQELCKTSQNAPFFKSESSPNFFSATISNQYGKDETILKSNNLSTDLFDGNSDAIKMWSDVWYLPVIYTMDNNENYYSINQFSVGEKIIPIYVYTAVSDTHHFSFKGAESFVNASCVWLEDLHTGNMYELHDSLSFSAYLSDTTYAARFLLHIGPEFETVVADNSCYNFNDGHILVAKNSGILYDANLYDAYGALVQSYSDINQIVEFDQLSAGNYVVHVTDQTCVSIIDTVIVNEPSPILANFVADADTIFLSGDEGTFNLINLSANASYYAWSVNDVVTSTDTNFTFSVNNPGTYEVSLKSSLNSTCYDSYQKELVAISVLDLELDNQPKVTILLSEGQLNVVTELPSVIKVYDQTGRIIFNANQAYSQQQIDVGSFAGQVIYVTVVNDKQNYTQKVFVF